jgi:DNA-directed RNA polymerase specialized sigma24 family protein
LVRGYEADPGRRQDLLQDIHIALWRSFAVFDERCSLRTWVYRVAHITWRRWIRWAVAALRDDTTSELGSAIR